MWHRKFDSSIWNFWEVKNHNQEFVTQSTSFTKGKKKKTEERLWGWKGGGSIEIRQNEAEIKNKQQPQKPSSIKELYVYPYEG